MSAISYRPSPRGAACTCAPPVVTHEANCPHSTPLLLSEQHLATYGRGAADAEAARQGVAYLIVRVES